MGLSVIYRMVIFIEYFVASYGGYERVIMDILSMGCFKTILEKYAEPIVRKVIEISKDEWEKFKVDFDFTFVEYTKKSYDKYSKIKTILYRTEPKNIYDFFEEPLLELEHKGIVKANSVNNILEISNNTRDSWNWKIYIDETFVY